MWIRPMRAARALSKAGFRLPGAGQVVLWETVPAPAAVAAALRCSQHLSSRSAVAHAELRSLSSRAAVINPRKEAGATADAPLRSPVAGGGGCGSAVTGAPSMLAKQEQKAIDELADMSIVDEVRRPAAVLPAAAAVSVCVDLRFARRRLCPFTCEGHTVQSPALASPLSRDACPCPADPGCCLARTCTGRRRRADGVDKSGDWRGGWTEGFPARRGAHSLWGLGAKRVSLTWNRACQRTMPLGHKF
jgi:hypothetical protein